VIEKVLATTGVTMDTVHAKTLALCIDEVERIDRMTMVAEGRRDSILREIDRRRMEFGRRLRRAVDEVQDAEFKEIVRKDVADANSIATDSIEHGAEHARGAVTIGANA
jgi:hypothetical protein